MDWRYPTAATYTGKFVRNPRPRAKNSTEPSAAQTTWTTYSVIADHSISSDSLKAPHPAFGEILVVKTLSEH
jgi:hypothetical protein